MCSSSAFFVPLVAGHDRQHLLDGGRQSDKHSPAHQAVPDVELDQVRDDVEEGKVRDVESVARVYLKAQRMRALGSGDQPFELDVPFAFGSPTLRVRSGVQFDELGTRSGGRLHLGGIGINEKTDLDTGILHAPGRLPDEGFATKDVQSTFGRHFGPLFGNQTDNVRLDLQGDVDDFRLESHLEIQPGPDGFAESEDVTINNVTPILSEMGGNSVGPGVLSGEGGGDGIGFALIATAITGLPQGGNVVDIDAEFEHFRGGSWGAGAPVARGERPSRADRMGHPSNG